MALDLALAFLVAAAAAAREPTVRDVSWTERVYRFKPDGETHRYTGGRYDLDSDGACAVRSWVRAVTFGDIDGDGKEEAVVVIATNLCGAGTSIDGYIYGLERGEAVLRAEIEGGDRGEGGIEAVAVVKGEIRVRRFDVGPRGGACCPDRVRIERWRWAGGKLVQQPGVRVVKRQPVPWSVARPSRRG
jgi:hypothetical protein